MEALLIAFLSFVGFIVAYNTYGRYLGQRIFRLSASNVAPSVELQDGRDYVPTRPSIVFGHHFTSIAGTGPIVGPAIAVFWGWLPALLWVVFGSIFVGAVHDFGSLVVSMRSRGQTLGDIAGRLISRRARILFLLILFFALMVIIGVFGLVIAMLFAIYPQTVLTVWLAMPLAVAVGFWTYKARGGLTLPVLLTLGLLYLSMYIGAYHLPITLGDLPLFAGADASFGEALASTVVIWTLLLLVYCYIASILPVWTLLQPRDFINANQLLIAMALLFTGLLVAQPELAAPAFNHDAPADAPSMFPFLFITIACGAVSGFHCLVASGTSSKQLPSERDARFVGYGGMLLEGALSVLVIVACCAGLGMGIYHMVDDSLVPILDSAGAPLAGSAAWEHYYDRAWGEMALGDQVGAFVEGSANMMTAAGIPLEMGIGIIAVMVASFAATTLDTATRLQRYVIQELGTAIRVPVLRQKHVATGIAVATGGAIAFMSGPQGPGSGGLILWPVFGATNQLLAGLAFLVVAFYLLRHGITVWFLLAPMALMIVFPAWAMSLQIIDWRADGNWVLFAIGVVVMFLQVWMVAEGALLWRKAKGVLPEPLPPLPDKPQAQEASRA